MAVCARARQRQDGARSSAATTAVALAALACGTDLPPGAGIDAGVPDDPWIGAEVSCRADADGAPARARVLRVLPWPGGGLQVLLGTAAAPAAPVAVEGAGGEAVASEVADIGAAAGGLTAIVVVPAEDPAAHLRRLAAARAVAAGLPADERIALLAAGPAGAALEPLADLAAGPGRAHLGARLDAIPPAAGRTAMPGAIALAGALAATEGSFGAVHRQVVVVGEAVASGPAPAGAPGEGPRPVVLRALEGAALRSDAAAGAAVAALLEEDAAARAAVRRVGVCGAAGAPLGPVVVRTAGTACTVAPPRTFEHLAALPCNAGAAARDEYPFPGEIELSFTAAERGVYDARVAASSKEDFRTSVRLGAGAPIGARAHLRGQTSLSCARKSYFVELDGGAPRRLLPRAASDRFLLISMCRDDGYFGQAFGDRLLAELGLFPWEHGVVRLRIDGVNRGAYLLLEHPDRAAVLDLLAPRAVIRRRFDPDGLAPEVELPADPAGAADALARYRALVAAAEEGPVAEIAARLEAGLDLDGYLAWMALASLLRNGDYVDEAYFLASEEAGAWRFRVAGWDPDDLFEACHHGGVWALADACGLLYCAEADLDRAILRSPEVYRRTGAAFERLLGELTAERLRATMDRVRADLFAVLADDETAAAMVELVAANPAAATAAGAQADIAARMEAMLAAAEARRAELRARLDACAELAP